MYKPSLRLTREMKELGPYRPDFLWSKVRRVAVPSLAASDSMSMKERRKLEAELSTQKAAERVCFARKRKLAHYLVSEIDFLTQMCRGRNHNAISACEKDFDYELLMNITYNPYLPFKLRAAVVHLVLVLYVDRFPQERDCGAPQLPEQIYIFEESGDSDSRKAWWVICFARVGDQRLETCFLAACRSRCTEPIARARATVSIISRQEVA